MALTFTTYHEILKIPFSPAAHRISYGQDIRQFGDLRVPLGEGPHPILVIIHGGCWTSKIANIDFMSAFAEAFKKQGIATWNIEYRCVDNQGGGWPGTFQDVSQAIDHLRVIAPEHQLDLKNVIVIGHSAGGHLALWSGARHTLAPDSDLFSSDPLPLKAVINLSGPGSLHHFLNIQEKTCGTKVINQLLGDDPNIFNKRLAQASPYELLPMTTKQILITGEYDKAAPVQAMEVYLNKAKTTGEPVELIILKDAAHFEVIDPGSLVWQTIKNKVLSLFNYGE